MKIYTVKVYDDRTEWFNEQGQLHREDGPAIEYADGDKEWWLNGTRVTKVEFNQKTNSCNNKVIEIDSKKYKLVQL